MPLQETSGNLTTDAYGGGVAAIPNYIEDVFSTYLYTGTGASLTITNGIDLSTKGGLVWCKARASAYDNSLYDTARGINKELYSNTTGAQYPGTGTLTSFNTDGFTLGSNSSANSGTSVSWTFRKQPKFFDVVTYTGTGSAQTISHSLGSTPGFLLIKKTSSTGNWICFARVGTSSGKFTYAYFNTDSGLNLTAAANASGVGAENLGYITSTAFKPQDLSGSGDGGVNDINASGATYVAYLFAHNAGGFGLTGTDNVISCGSYTGTGAAGNAVSLGYEPQWVLIKKATGTADNWYISDNMRGMSLTDGGVTLLPNTSDSEYTGLGNISPTATGFVVNNTNSGYNASGQTYIYIAIRRGPMKVPTDGTKVFKPNTVSSDASAQTTNFPVDMFFTNKRAGDALNTIAVSKLTSNSGLVTSSTAAEAANYASATWWQSNTSYTAGVWGTASIVDYAFQRAPSFFDEVCYTGTGSTTTQTHNLGVVPELIIIKCRSNANAWYVEHSFTSSTWALSYLNYDYAASSGRSYDTVCPAQPTSSVFSLGSNSATNSSGNTFTAYLFATCAGVSKVGSYTGNGTTQTINCGFAGGARFVLIKRTDSTGGWYVYDTARGMTTLTDPYLFLNSTAAESATLGSVTTVTTGFAVNASILAAINTNGASYIFLAIS